MNGCSLLIGNRQMIGMMELYPRTGGRLPMLPHSTLLRFMVMAIAVIAGVLRTCSRFPIMISLLARRLLEDMRIWLGVRARLWVR